MRRLRKMALVVEVLMALGGAVEWRVESWLQGQMM